MNGNQTMWLSLIWLPILFYIMLRNEIKFKKNITVGVTLPYEARQNPAVLERLHQFDRQELAVCVGLMVLGLAGMFLKFSMSLTLWFVWLTLCVIVPYVPYVLCNRDLKQIKLENGWKQPRAMDTVTVDLRAMPQTNWISPWAFLPAVILAVFPALFDRATLILYLIDGLLVGFMWFCYRFLYRNKSEMVDSNTTVTAALTRIRRNLWGKMWLICAYAMAVLSWLGYLTMYSPVAMTIGIVCFTAVLLAATLYVEFHARKLQETLTADSGKDNYVDDDDKWLGGLVYYNPNDDRLMINNRIGLNSSVNLAKPAGKLLYGLLAVVIVTMPFWGLVMGGTGIETTLSPETVTIKGGLHKYTIDTASVTEVEWLDTLPSISRTAGTGFPELYGGDFSMEGYGAIKACLDPTTPPYVLVKTDQLTYLLGTRTLEETKALYEALQ